jgi:DNA polymerase-1
MWPSPEQIANRTWVCDTETDGLLVRGPQSRDKAWIVGLLDLHSDEVGFIDTQDPRWPQFQRALESCELIGHNLRFDIHAMNINPAGWDDTMAGWYWTNTTAAKSLDDIAKYLGRAKVPTLPELKGKKGEQNEIRTLRYGHQNFDVKLMAYLLDDLKATKQLYEQHGGARKEEREVEWAVQRMEDRGVKLLTGPLEKLRARIQPLVAEAEATIRSYGFDGNIASPKQLQEFLESRGYDFWDMVWNKKKRVKERKFSTATKTVLVPYHEKTQDPLIGALMMYRSWLKKEKDFCQKLPTFIQPDGLIHGGINTCRTATTRFSHEDPNLGQIPKQGKTALEREVSKAFRACFTGPGGYVSGADYSQVELRVAAILSGDSRMLEAFANGEDPHAATAAATSGCPVDALPDGERFKAKATNFGILNGMKAKRLALGIGTSEYEAARFIEKHQEAHPELHEWMEYETGMAEECWYAEHFDGATRYYDGGSINSAVSMKVQGGAAVLMRRALVELERQDFRPILTVHDEIVCDIVDKGDEIAMLMEEVANKTLPGPIRFTAGGGSGETWAAV